mgnify:CR=1 FL=1
MIYISHYLFNLSDKIRNLYLNSNIYDKKISKITVKNFTYKPSSYLLNSLINYKKKNKIEDFFLEDIWENKNLSNKEYKNLNCFYWFFNLDLKSSKETTHLIIKNWIKKNEKFKKESWDFDLTAKRVIAWLSCHNLTYEDGNSEHRKRFNNIIICIISKHLITNHSEGLNFLKYVGLLIIQAFGYYYLHWAMHNNRVLRKIHKFHHRFTDVLIPSLGVSVTIMEYSFAYSSPFLLGSYLLNTNLTTLSYAICTISLLILL